MVIRCEVCKKIKKIHPGLSFHRFPKNNARKMIWFSLLGITDSKALKNRAVVCSDHFNRSDFFIKNERQYLKTDALPLPFMSPFMQPGYSSSSETSSGSTSSGKSLSKPRDMRNEYGEVKLGTLSRTSSSSTLTASETDIPNPKYDMFSSPVEAYQMNIKDDSGVLIQPVCRVSPLKTITTLETEASRNRDIKDEYGEVKVETLTRTSSSSTSTASEIDIPNSKYDIFSLPVQSYQMNIKDESGELIQPLCRVSPLNTITALETEASINRDIKDEYGEVKLETLSRTSPSLTFMASEFDIPSLKYDIFSSPVQSYEMNIKDESRELIQPLCRVSPLTTITASETQVSRKRNIEYEYDELKPEKLSRILPSSTFTVSETDIPNPEYNLFSSPVQAYQMNIKNESGELVQPLCRVSPLKTITALETRDIKDECGEVKLETVSRTSPSSTFMASEIDIPNPNYDIFSSPVQSYEMNIKDEPGELIQPLCRVSPLKTITASETEASNKRNIEYESAEVVQPLCRVSPSSTITSLETQVSTKRNVQYELIQPLGINTTLPLQTITASETEGSKNRNVQYVLIQRLCRVSPLKTNTASETGVSTKRNIENGSAESIQPLWRVSPSMITASQTEVSTRRNIENESADFIQPLWPVSPSSIIITGSEPKASRRRYIQYEPGKLIQSLCQVLPSQKNTVSGTEVSKKRNNGNESAESIQPLWRVPPSMITASQTEVSTRRNIEHESEELIQPLCRVPPSSIVTASKTKVSERRNVQHELIQPLGRALPLQTVTASETEGSKNRSIENESAELIQPFWQVTTLPSSMVIASEPKSQVPKRRKRRYIGDLTCEDFDTPIKREKNLKLVQEQFSTYRKKIKELGNTVRKLQTELKMLKGLVKQYKEKKGLVKQYKHKK